MNAEVRNIALTVTLLAATALAETEHAEGTTLGRYSLDKIFHGELEARSRGEMLTAGTAVAGSAG